MLTEIKLLQNTHSSLQCYSIEPVRYSEEKQMLTEIKLVQHTHWSLQCWYRTGLVFRRKTNANRNKSGTKYIHTAPYNAGIEPVWYSEEKQMLTRIKLVQNTHCSLQCWYTCRTTLVFRRKTNANRNQTGAKYTLVLTIIV